MHPFIEIFGRTIGTYALLAMAGLLISGAVASRLGRLRQIASEDILLLLVSVSVGLLIGGHLLYGLTHPADTARGLWRLLTAPSWNALYEVGICFGGMVFYGGLFGAMAATAIHTRCVKTLARKDVWDLLAVTVPLFHTFGRVGCFLGGCCYGVESTWGFAAPQNPLQPSLGEAVRLPVQLLEAGGNLLLFGLLLIGFCRQWERGRLLYVYLPLYAVMRFCLEFWRGDSIRGVWWGLSTSQWISLLLLGLLTINWLAVWIRRSKAKTV